MGKSSSNAPASLSNIPAAGNAQSSSYDTASARRAKWFITSSGANCTATPQFSLDGTNWFNGTAYALAATGPQAVIDMPGPFCRLSVANAGAGAQSFAATLVVETL